MSTKTTVITPTMRPDVIGDIEKGNGVFVTSNSKIQVHVSTVIKGTTPQLVVDGKVVHAGGIPSRDKIEQWFVANA